jgi:hypothetical protein
MKRFFHHPFFIRLLNWEYWPFGAVYCWTIPAWLFFCLRSRSFFFFSASNPSIKNGGLIGESKKDIHRILPCYLYPKTIHFDWKTETGKVISSLEQEGFSFPLIGKPDIGGKGRGVKLLYDKYEVKAYAENARMDYHIQEYISYPNEVGIYYHRYPDRVRGSITGIVCKKFLTVTGNGKSSLLELLNEDSRSIMYLESLEQMHRSRLQEIIPDGKEMVVSHYGNHARGSKFLDCSGMADDELLDTIDAISKTIPGFYFGRFDIRFRSWDLLRKGKEFTIIEVNGAGAEPTHMYDPRHSIFFAWKEIIRHWNIMEKISRMNHKKGVPFLTFRQGIRIFREDKEIVANSQAMGE